MPAWEGQSPSVSLHNGLRLAQAVEALGFRRYWVAEHHNTPSVASSSPPVLIGQIAAHTSTIRVGSGGVMLPNHPPLVVAEQFATLASYHPGRIDLGIGRAPGTDPVTAGALRRPVAPMSAADFPEQLKELQHYLHGSTDPSTSRMEIRVTPAVEDPPPVWLLGSSPSSALLAASRGLPFAYANHLVPAAAEPSVRAYRDNFTPSDHLAEPYVIVSALVVAADTDEEALWHSASFRWALIEGSRNPFIRFPPPDRVAGHRYGAAEQRLIERQLANQLVGGPEAVRAGLEELLELTGADEVMGFSPIHDHDARVRSYELLAAAAGLR